METIQKILRFPNKAQRRRYKKKLFSLYTTIDIFVVTAGVLLAEFILWLIS